MRVLTRARAFVIGGILLVAGGSVWMFQGANLPRAVVQAGLSLLALAVIWMGWRKNASPPESKPAAAETPPETASLVFLVAKRILVIKESESDVRKITEVLEGAGYVCRVLQSPLRVLEILQIFQPHLIITGLQMTGLDGMGLIHLVKREQGQDIPILVISASRGKTYINQAYAQGADDYLFTPFEPDELLARVAWALEKKESRGEKGADR